VSDNSQRQCELPMMAQGLDETLSVLAEVINKLSDRLTPILREPEPQSETEVKEPGAYTPLGSRLNGIREGYEGQIHRLRSLIIRLEI